MWLASFLALSATARAASSTELPAVTVWRLANAPSPIATPAVSPGTTVISSARKPSSLAAICASAVCKPCPIAAAPVIDRDAAGVRYPHDAGFERAAAGALDAVREPDADIAAFGARRALALLEVVPAGGLEHHRLTGGIVAAVILHGRAGARFQRLGVGHLLGRDEVAPAQLGAVDTQLARHPVHHPLHRERRLRIAGAADRGDRRLVGGGDRDVHLQRRHDVGAAHHRGGIVRDVDVLQRVGADVVDQVAAHAQNLAVGVDRDVDRPVLIALLRRIGEVLAPVLDPFDRAPRELGGRDHRDVFGIDAQLRPETAADVGRRHPQPALVEAEQRGERLEQIMRLLRRGPGGDASHRRAGIRRGCRGPRSDGRRRGAARGCHERHARPWRRRPASRRN